MRANHNLIGTGPYSAQRNSSPPALCRHSIPSNGVSPASRNGSGSHPGTRTASYINASTRYDARASGGEAARWISYIVVPVLPSWPPSPCHLAAPQQAKVRRPSTVLFFFFPVSFASDAILISIWCVYTIPRYTVLSFHHFVFLGFCRLDLEFFFFWNAPGKDLPVELIKRGVIITQRVYKKETTLGKNISTGNDGL